MSDNEDLIKEEENSRKEETFSEPDDLVKSVGGNIELIDENTIEAEEMKKGTGDMDSNDLEGFHIEEEGDEGQAND